MLGGACLKIILKVKCLSWHRKKDSVITMLLLAFVLTFLSGFSFGHVLQQSTARFCSPPAAGQFRAAVYEHELVLPSECLDRVCSRQEAVQLMERNLAVLEDQILEAASQGYIVAGNTINRDPVLQVPI